MLIAKQAKILFEAYRKDQFDHPESFALQAQQVFEGFSERVILRVTDSGNIESLQRRHKFPPNIEEIGAACVDEQERQFKIAKAAREPKVQFNRAYTPPPSFPGCRARIFVHAEAPQYQTLLDWSRTSDADERDWVFDDGGKPGIWIANTVWQSFAQLGTRPGAWKPASDAAVSESLLRMAGQKRAEEFFE